jgi:hypothetical protein
MRTWSHEKYRSRFQPRLRGIHKPLGDQALLGRVRQGVEDYSRVTISHRGRSPEVMEPSGLPFGTAFTVEEHKTKLERRTPVSAPCSAPVPAACAFEIRRALCCVHCGQVGPRVWPWRTTQPAPRVRESGVVLVVGARTAHDGDRPDYPTGGDLTRSSTREKRRFEYLRLQVSCNQPQVG